MHGIAMDDVADVASLLVMRMCCGEVAELLHGGWWHRHTVLDVCAEITSWRYTYPTPSPSRIGSGVWISGLVAAGLVFSAVVTC